MKRLGEAVKVKRLIEQTACKHGEWEKHCACDAVSDWAPCSNPCEGGSSREVTLEGLQRALDVVIDNLLPPEHHLVIDVEQLIAMELET